MRRVLVVLLVCALAVLLLTAAAAPAKRAADDCTWGASSVMVQEVDGQLVQSEPATSGCIPH
jgi:hypothetical protein